MPPLAFVADEAADGAPSTKAPPSPRITPGTRGTSSTGALLLGAGSAVMALGAVALYVASYWSYYEGYVSTEPAPPPARTALPIFSVDQTVALVVLAMIPLVGLLNSRWPIRLAARSAVVALAISALSSLVKVWTRGPGTIVLSGPLPAWSWLLAIPVVWVGGGLAWIGLGSRFGEGAGPFGNRWGPPLVAVWACVLGVVLTSIVLWPEEWILMTGTATLAGLLLTLAGPAWHRVSRSASG